MTTFTKYLHLLQSQYLDTAPIHLILDLYSVHRCEPSRACVVELGIVLHFIPAGWTDEL
jgi:transposase